MNVRPFIAAFVFIVVAGSIEAQARTFNSIHGAVVDPDGKMIEKFNIVVRPFVDKPILIQRKHFSNGIFQLGKLDRQKYEIVITARRYTSAHMEVDFPKNGGANEFRMVILHPLVNDKYFPVNPP